MDTRALWYKDRRLSSHKKILRDVNLMSAFDPKRT